MSYCINPECPHPQNSDKDLFCQYCGSELLLEGTYRVLRKLGGGGFGLTYEVVDETGIEKVLKVLYLNDKKAVCLFQQEAKVLKQLNYKGIPKVDENGYFTCSIKADREPLHCLVMEKIEGSDLQAWLEKRGKPINQKLAIKWLIDLTTILNKVHKKRFFHRDIKPANIMLRPNGELVLIDFGIVKEITATFMASQNTLKPGTIAYSRGYSPREQENGHTVPQSDFFALGRTFVFLLTGKYPLTFYDPNIDKLNWRSTSSHISPMLADFIDDLMANLPTERPANCSIALGRLSEIEKYSHQEQQSSLLSNILHLTSITTKRTNYREANTKFKKVFFIGSAILLLGIAGFLYNKYPIQDIIFSGNGLETRVIRNSAAVLSLAKSPDEQILVSGNYDGTIKIWDLKTNELKYNLTAHSGRVNDIAISPDGRILVSGSGDGTIRVWNIAIGRQIISSLKSGSARVVSIAISPDGQRFASGSDDGNITIWNLFTGKKITDLRDGTARVNSLVFSTPNLNILASGGNDGIVRIWDLSKNTNEPIHQLEDDNSRVLSIAISPDGQRLASGGYDKNIRIWNLRNQILERTLKSHSFVVASVAFSSDGQKLASASYDNTIRIWNLSTGNSIQKLTGHIGFVYSVVFSSNGSKLYSSGYDGTIRIWKGI